MKPPLFFIGSLPFVKFGPALEFVARYSTHLPFLPQLPSGNPQEDMVGQVLRGFEIGGWDDSASLCLAGFLFRFSGAPRVKFQIAGPATISRVMSRPIEDISARWLNLVESISGQFSRAGFRGELWIQLDEPFWSQARPLFNGYQNLVLDLKKISPKFRIGIHSCALPRPSVPESLARVVDFFSFDYTSDALTAEENVFWKQYLTDDRLLVAGLIGKEGRRIAEGFGDLPEKRVWISSGCGLYDWGVDEMERAFKD